MVYSSKSKYINKKAKTSDLFNDTFKYKFSNLYFSGHILTH